MNRKRKKEKHIGGFLTENSRSCLQNTLIRYIIDIVIFSANDCKINHSAEFKHFNIALLCVHFLKLRMFIQLVLSKGI